MRLTTPEIARAFLVPEATVAIVDGLANDKPMQRYHLLPTVRGDLLQRLGRHDEACQEFRRAAGMAGHARERALLQGRAADAARTVGRAASA